eukprot:m.286584 g.286584  ORF g.286584 m.286584 type:complete len:656 (+) comp11597_c0_seq1:33-2000(+)
MANLLRAASRTLPTALARPVMASYATAPSFQHKAVQAFVDKAVSVCKPKDVHICTGSQEEFVGIMDALVEAGTCVKLNEEKRPGCWLAFTDPADVARAEADTFICSKNASDSGPTNNWRDPSEMKKKLAKMFDGCMEGRTMYVVPFSMGPIGSPLAKIGIQVTDSSYVAANMRIMTRMGTKVLDALGTTGEFVPCMHSVGRPLVEDPTDPGYAPARSTWPCNIKKRHVTHFPESREIWSFGSGYGGNSLLGKKCFALRIASVQARDEGWLAEHMLILGITNPAGEKKYIAAAFPSACGKTNLAMMNATLPGWKVECVGDDIAWMRFGDDGRLYAINPENGFFGVAPGTSMSSNPNAMKTCESNTLFTNVGLTEDRDVWWEGMGPYPEGNTMDWRRNQWWLPTMVPTNKGPGTGVDGSGYKYTDKINPCAQGNSRFTTPIKQCPVLDSEWENPKGVPIEAIIFGGRRDNTVPLVYEAFDWEHGTYIGSTLRSMATGASDQSGMTHDPMAMKAFCGYNIKDYFAHWLNMSNREGAKLPKIYQVNWFQKDSKGKFIWPGFGDNSRVLAWIIGRVSGTAEAQDTPIGRIPAPGAIDTSGLDITQEQMDQLFKIDKKLWAEEVAAINKYYTEILFEKGDKKPVPEGLLNQLDKLTKRLGV